MKTRAIITIAILISAVLLAVELSPIVNKGQFREGDYVHFDRMEIAFDGPDADVSVHYQLRPFAQTYMFLFGSRHLESKIEDIFFDFEKAEVTGIGRKEAEIRITNISRPKDKHYLHDSRKLGTRTDMLVLIYPDGNRSNVPNAGATPDTYYKIKSGPKHTTF